MELLHYFSFWSLTENILRTFFYHTVSLYGQSAQHEIFIKWDHLPLWLWISLWHISINRWTWYLQECNSNACLLFFKINFLFSLSLSSQCRKHTKSNGYCCLMKRIVEKHFIRVCTKMILYFRYDSLVYNPIVGTYIYIKRFFLLSILFRIKMSLIHRIHM